MLEKHLCVDFVDIVTKTGFFWHQSFSENIRLDNLVIFQIVSKYYKTKMFIKPKMLQFFKSLTALQMVFRSIRQKLFCKKAVLENFAKFTGKHLCRNLVEACNFTNKETPAQAFFCKFCKILRTSPVVASQVSRTG